MAKTYQRTHILMAAAGLQVPCAPLDADPKELFSIIAAKYWPREIQMIDEGRICVDGVTINHFKFCRGVLFSLESRNRIDHESVLAAIETVAKRHILKEHKKSSRRVESFAKISWVNGTALAGVSTKAFYASPEWRRVRYSVLEKHGNRCMACGRGPRNGIIIHVDHIKPRSIFPELALDLANLQILCEDCNLGKMADFQTDWRFSKAASGDD